MLSILGFSNIMIISPLAGTVYFIGSLMTIIVLSNSLGFFIFISTTLPTPWGSCY